MKAHEIRLLAKSIRHTRLRQLWARLRLIARRKRLAFANRIGIPPGEWYRRAAPAWRASAPVGPAISTTEGLERLPITVDLVGTPYEITASPDWQPESLARGTYLERLHLHYMEYVTRLQPGDAAQLMVDWAKRVPPYKAGYWRDSWNSYALSIRVVAWLDVLTAHRSRMDAAARAIAEQSVAAQIRFLERNLETDIGGNHLMKNLRALLRAGSCFQGEEPRRWTLCALARLDAQITEQILPDGMHFELSPAYHLQVMEDLMDMRRSLLSLEEDDVLSLQCAKARQRIEDSLRSMADVVGLTTHPDGLPSLFGDGGLHMTQTPSTLLNHLEREHILPAGRALPCEGPWRLPHGGYVGLRSSDGLFMCDCGAVGAACLPAHGHGDALSMEWSLHGRRFIIDPGVYEYHAGPRRAYSRSTAAHSTVTLDDQDQSEFWSSFRVGDRARVTVDLWQPTPRGFILSAFHDGYRRLAGKPTHHRRIEAGPGGISVLDEVRGGRGQTARARLLFAPGVTIESLEPTVEGGCIARVSVPAVDSPSDVVRARILANVPMRSEAADSSPDFGVIAPTTRLVLELGKAPCSAQWSIQVEGT